jgi:YidC/Oxa1 family membrane protein insertase
MQLVLEAEAGGVKLTKTFTFKRGDYVIDVRHDVTNVGTAPIKPNCTCNWRTTATSRRRLVLQQQLHRSDPVHRRTNTRSCSSKTGKSCAGSRQDRQAVLQDHPTKADNGWIAISQHFFVSAFVPQTSWRDIFTTKVDTNLYAIGVTQPLGTWRRAPP